MVYDSTGPVSITFNDICSLFESIERVSTLRPRLPSIREKSNIQQIIVKWFCSHRNAIENPETNGAAVLSTLFPHRRKDRVYGLKTPSLAKRLKKLLCFNHEHNALFEQYAVGRHGDLGACTERAVKPRDGTFKKYMPISIDRIDKTMVQLAARYRFSDPAIRAKRDRGIDTDAELKNILIRLQSWEVKWLVRLILRDLCSIQLDEQLVFKQYHFLLPDLLQFQNDFDAAFQLLRGELAPYPFVPDDGQELAMRIEAGKKLHPIVGVKIGRPTFYKAWSFSNCLGLAGQGAWAAEVKYDGEYCEIHVNLDVGRRNIQIFSKNGKDATADRQALHSTIRTSLRIGQPDCLFKRKCIVLGEIVPYCDEKQKILPFSKIRNHIQRSGTFIGIADDSPPNPSEHLMVVFFDVLLLDDKPILRHNLQRRRQILRDLVQNIPGRSMRSEWTLVDFQSDDGVTDLMQAFARTLAKQQEGLILKPLHSPYFSFCSSVGSGQPAYFIKLKKDYLADMGGERDLGDFAIIGARLDAQVAPKAEIKSLHWTTFYIGCATNKVAAHRTGAKPTFKVVGSICFDKCIPEKVLEHLNTQGRLRETELQEDGSIDHFNIEHAAGTGPRMSIAFKQPFVAEILGGGYEKRQDESFEMLRHPRITKVHHDRTWEDAVCMEELARMADEKWEVPDASKLGGYGRHIALLAKKYAKELAGSQASTSEYETTQATTQCTTPRTTQDTDRQTPSEAAVQGTQQHAQATWTSASSMSPCPNSKQNTGIQASRQVRILVREDTPERLPSDNVPQAPQPPPLLTPPVSSGDGAPATCKKRSTSSTVVTPPPLKRRRTPAPLTDAGSKRNLGTFDYDSQEKVIHVYAEAGWKVEAHSNIE